MKDSCFSHLFAEAHGKSLKILILLISEIEGDRQEQEKLLGTRDEVNIKFRE